jgi:DNA repair exonuclease SbcCD nuclease subunit
LRDAADYVALGHTHRRFEIDNWVFNPGSIEITSISDYRETRGVFVVEVRDDNTITARHIDEYLHRPFQRLDLDVSGRASGEEITTAAIEKFQNEGRRSVENEPAPIIELTLRGILGLPNSQLDLRRMRDEGKRITGALHIRIRNHTRRLITRPRYRKRQRGTRVESSGESSKSSFFVTTDSRPGPMKLPGS